MKLNPLKRNFFTHLRKPVGKNLAESVSICVFIISIFHIKTFDDNSFISSPVISLKMLALFCLKYSLKSFSQLARTNFPESFKKNKSMRNLLNFANRMIRQNLSL